MLQLRRPITLRRDEHDYEDSLPPPETGSTGGCPVDVLDWFDNPDDILFTKIERAVRDAPNRTPLPVESEMWTAPLGAMAEGVMNATSNVYSYKCD